MKDDAISRQAAINTLIRESQADGAYGYLDAKSISDALERMPSARPDVPDTNVGDMINRQAAIDTVRSYYDECDEREESIEERIERLPSAERHGKWLHKNGIFKNRWLCSECGYTWYFDTAEANYCSRCGARMDEVAQNDIR